MSAALQLAALDGEKYINLETFRKNGIGVRTPVWFASVKTAGEQRTLYVYAVADSGKVKRIRRNGTVRIAPCDLRGNATGSWIEARARIVPEDTSGPAMRLLDRKYRPWKQILGLLRRLRPGGPKPRAVIAIQLP